MGLSDFGDKIKNGAKSLGNSFKNAFNEIKNEFQELDKNIADKQAINDAFIVQAVKYEILGKSGFLTDKVYIYGINDFRLLKKEIYFRSSDKLDNLLVGTILVNDDKRFEIKELFKTEVKYYELTYKDGYNEKEEKAEIPCVVANVKEIK